MNESPFLGQEDVRPVLPTPNEHYIVQYDSFELARLYRAAKRPIILWFALWSVIMVIALFAIAAADAHASFALLWFVVSGVGVFRFARTLKRIKTIWENNIEKMRRTTYDYAVYDTYFVLHTYRDNELMRFEKFACSDIQHIRPTAEFLAFEINGQAFYLRRNEIPRTSALFYGHQTNGHIAALETMPWRIASVVLFWASIAALLGAMITQGWYCAEHLQGAVFSRALEGMWLFFLFVPIPAASLVFGIAAKKKQYRFTKNIVIAAITIPILCLYGSFAFVFGGMYDHSDAAVVRVEQALSMEIPAYNYIATEERNPDESIHSRNAARYLTNVCFDEDEATAFEASMDERWMHAIPTTLQGIAAEDVFDSKYDRFLLYNTDTAAYNAIPEKDGTYTFIGLYYSTEDNVMEIAEYTVVYTRGSNV